MNTFFFIYVALGFVTTDTTYLPLSLEIGKKRNAAVPPGMP